MKKFLSSLFVVVAVFLGAPALASADVSPVPIHLTIVTLDQTLFDGNITIDPCFNSQFGPTVTVNAFCALTQVASSSGWTVDALWSQYGVFVNSINAYAPTSLSGPYWLYYTNGESALTGLDAHILTSGEHILLTFGISPLRVVAATTTPHVGSSTLLQVQYFDTDSSFDWVSATTSTVMVNGVPLLSDANGKLAYIPVSTSSVTVSAEAEGHVGSEAITLTPYNDIPPLSTIPGTLIHLDIETYDGTLYKNDVTVYPCPDTEFGTSTTMNAFCAVNQVASSSGWSLATTWYSFGESLDGINSYTSDFVNNRYWLYYIDRVSAPVGLGAHLLSPGEEILLTYGTAPLRIVASSTSLSVGTQITLTSQVFDSASTFDWAPATGTTFILDGVATSSDAEGNLTLTLTSTPIVVSITKPGFIGSKSITITPTGTLPPVSPGGGTSGPDTTHTIDISKAVQFLYSLQSADGSFGAALYTDWVAVGLSGLSGIPGADNMRSKLKTYLITHTDPGGLLTDAERRAMALEALGVDPAQGTSRNYISEIVAKYDGTQFGDTNQVNDDIFALIPLMHAGYAVSDPAITSAANFIVSKQDSSGSWGSVDLTAAGIESLEPLTDIAGVTNAIARAKAYLHQSQQNNGGFGSSFATSWVLNAINGMPNEVLSRDWVKGGRTPSDYLWLLQQADGGIDTTSLDTNSRVWATAYALTGGSGKDWNTVLGSYTKYTSAIVQSGGIGGEVLGAATASSRVVSSATSTVVSTSTASQIKTGTSTEMFILVDITATSSATSTIAKADSTKVKANVKAKNGKIKKKTVMKEVVKQTASAGNASPKVAPAADEPKKETKGIGGFIVNPFSRFFQFVGSWF